MIGPIGVAILNYSGKLVNVDVYPYNSYMEKEKK